MTVGILRRKMFGHEHTQITYEESQLQQWSRSQPQPEFHY